MRFLLLLCLRLAALGMLAAGLSGLLAEPLSWKTGVEHFTGDARARVGELSVERCAELARLHRRQPACAGALVEEQFDELVQAGLVVTLLAGALLLLLERFASGPRDQKEATLEAVLLTAAAVAFAAVAAADLPPGLAGLERLEPGSGRALLQGGLAALFGGWLAVRAVERWRHLAG